MKTRFIALFATVFLAACADSSMSAGETDTPPTAAPADLQPAPADTRYAADQTTAAPAPDRIELAQADSTATDLAAAGFREGQHYVRLSPVQPTSTGPDQVEVAEFFMYSCIHCYNFEPYVEQWLASKADYVNFVRVPTVWNAVVRLHAQAFYAAAALDKGEEMHTPFFREMHVNGNYLQTEEQMAEFFANFGVDREAFDNAFQSFAVNTNLRRADELARRYGIDSTPTVVVNGKYRTNASMAGGYPEMLDLINALAASEREQM